MSQLVKRFGRIEVYRVGHHVWVGGAGRGWFMFVETMVRGLRAWAPPEGWRYLGPVLVHVDGALEHGELWVEREPGHIPGTPAVVVLPRRAAILYGGI